MGGPLQLLPEEIWGLIIEELEDSRDIVNVFKAFPELATGIQTQKKKALWLFDQVIPHVFEWLPSKDALACRRTCKRWSRAVDNVMENHFTLSARANDNESPDCSESSKIWIKKTVLRRRFMNSGSTPATTIRSEEGCAEYLKTMDKHLVTKRNPFVGRMLLIQERGIYFHDMDGERDKLFTASVDILRKFGGDVWYLELGSCARRPNPRRFCEAVLDSLDHVPNLRRLDLVGEIFLPRNVLQIFRQELPGTPEDLEDFINSRGLTLPNLPHLETLLMSMRGIPHPLASILMTSYASQLTRLSLELTLWQWEYKSWTFPNLTTFSVIGDSRRGICKLLEEINAPQLVCLGVDMVAGEYMIEEDIIWKLSRFTQIQHLHLWCGHSKIIETGCLCLPMDSIPSIKSLVIKDGIANMKLQYKFLEAFPSLEYLFIESTRQPLSEDLVTKDGIRIREYIPEWDMYESNVWEYLPSLKEVFLRELTHTIAPHAVTNRPCKRFTRKEYACLKKFEEELNFY